MIHRPSRRAVLTSLIGVCALGLAGAVGSLRTCSRRSTATAARLDRLDVALERIFAPHRIGHSYRAARTETALLRELTDKPGLRTALDLNCSASRAARIAEQIRADFHDGDVLVEGRWVVSRSECIIAALRST